MSKRNSFSGNCARRYIDLRCWITIFFRCNYTLVTGANVVPADTCKQRKPKD